MVENCSKDCANFGRIILLNCGYKDGPKVKKLGAKWDKAWQMWYISCCVDQARFKPWLFATAEQGEINVWYV